MRECAGDAEPVEYARTGLWLAGWGATGPSWPLDVAGLTVFFAALFGGAAWLFPQAAREKVVGAGPAS